MHNEATARALDSFNVRRGIHLAETSQIPDVVDETPFWQQRGLDLGIMTMTMPTKPYWNTTMVTAWVAVIGLIVVLLSAVGGLYVYTRDKAYQDGYERGRQAERQVQQDDKMKSLQNELEVHRDQLGLNPPKDNKPKEKK